MMRLLICILLVLPQALFAQPLLPTGKGIIKIDLSKTSAISFYSSSACEKILHKVELKTNNVGVVELKEKDQAPTWFEPEQFHPSYDIFMLRVDSITPSAVRVFIDAKGNTAWMAYLDGMEFTEWNTFLRKHVSSLQTDEWHPLLIKSQPINNSALIKVAEASDCFKVVEIRGNWIKIRSDIKSGCSETKRPVSTGWLQWNKNNRLQVSYTLMM